MISENGNTSQRHGIDLENMIKASWMFDGACDAFRLRNGIVDIEGKHDRFLGIDTSVKAVTRDGWVGLADATRFYEIQVPRRFLIGEWIQLPRSVKQFISLHEIILTPAILRIIRGSITAEEVENWHLAIASCPDGMEGAKLARQKRDEVLSQIKGKHHPILRFEFKIGNVEERRLQLSIHLPRFVELMKNLCEDLPDYRAANGNEQPHYILHDEFFCQYPLPFCLRSPERRILKEKELLSETDSDNLFEELPSLKMDKAALPKMPRRRDRESEAFDADLQKALFE